MFLFHVVIRPPDWLVLPPEGEKTQPCVVESQSASINISVTIWHFYLMNKFYRGLVRVHKISQLSFGDTIIDAPKP